MKKQTAWLLALALLLCGCAPQTTAATAPTLREPAAVSVGTVTAVRGELYDIASYDAYVTPCTQVLTFGYNGKMGELFVKEGDVVEAGTVLATMDNTATQEKLDSLEDKLADIKKKGQFADRIAKADIRIAEAELAIMEEEGATAAECDVKKAQIAQLEAKLDQAQELRSLERKPVQQQIDQLKKQIQEQDVIAPFTGTVIYVSRVKQGKSIGAETPVVVLADDSRLQIRCEEKLNEALLGQAYRIYVRVKDQDYTLTWTVPEEPAPDAQQQEPAETTVFDVTEEMAGKVQSGQYAPVQVILSYRADVLKLPASAVKRDAAGYYVYRIEDGRRVRQDVKTGIRAGVDMEILEGLQEGDAVYAD